MNRHIRPGIGLQRKPLDLPPTRLAEILTVPVGSACSGCIPDKNTVLLMSATRRGDVAGGGWWWLSKYQAKAEDKRLWAMGGAWKRGWPLVARCGDRGGTEGGYLCAGRMVNFVGGVAGWPVLDGEHSILAVGMMLSSIKGGDLPEKGMDRCFRCRAGMRAWEGGRRQSWRHAGCRRGRHWGHCGPRGAEEGSGRAAGLGGA